MWGLAYCLAAYCSVGNTLCLVRSDAACPAVPNPLIYFFYSVLHGISCVHAVTCS
jgi:hypothetical protein